jgi:anti-sigma factor RsiW
MEHEEIFIFMMEALDDELEPSGQLEMRTHLESCPSCSREWEGIQAIHQLFLETPALSPAAGFAERTIGLLPNPAYRLWMGSVVYGLLFISGLLPVVAILWLTSQFGPALEQPAFVDGVLRAGGQVAQLGNAVLDAVRHGVVNAGELVGQQPAIIGLLLVMVGAILLWGGVYSQLTNPRRVNSL